MNQKCLKIKVSITKAANAKHRIVKRNIANVLKEEFPVIQINVNARIVRMESMIILQIFSHKISK